MTFTDPRLDLLLEDDQHLLLRGPVVCRELLEQALGDEGGEGHILSVLLHLFLGVLRTLEGEVVQSHQHPPPTRQHHRCFLANGPFSCSPILILTLTKP